MTTAAWEKIPDKYQDKIYKLLWTASANLVTKVRADNKRNIQTIMNAGIKGVEIDAEVADSRQSVILHQVRNGVAVRMAVLYLLAGGEVEPKA